jgi:hypothetical protein
VYCWKCGLQLPDGVAFCAGCGSRFTVADQGMLPPQQELNDFPVWLLVLLHYLTCGIFSLVWINYYHAKLPQTRPDDPSGGKAVGYMFIPFYNFYWVFFSHIRLCERLDDERVRNGLAPTGLSGLVVATCILQVIPYVNYASFGILYPITAGLLQSKINELVAATRARMGYGIYTGAPAQAMTRCGWCSACMRQNSANSRFCAFCGADLTASNPS